MHGLIPSHKCCQSNILATHDHEKLNLKMQCLYVWLFTKYFLLQKIEHLVHTVTIDNYSKRKRITKRYINNYYHINCLRNTNWYNPRESQFLHMLPIKLSWIVLNHHHPIIAFIKLCIMERMFSLLPYLPPFLFMLQKNFEGLYMHM